MSPDNWVVLTKIFGEIQAEIIRGLLESQGILPQLNQEGAGRAYGLSVGPLGEVEILVPKDKLKEAKEVLARFDSGEFEVDEEESES